MKKTCHKPSIDECPKRCVVHSVLKEKENNDRSFILKYKRRWFPRVPSVKMYMK